MNVIVTGAAGFIGSNLCERILETTDWTIYAVDNLGSGPKVFRNFFEPLRAKYKNRLHYFNTSFKNFVHNEIEHHCQQIDVVFHLAATPRVAYSVEYPVLTNDNNVSETLHLLEWARKTGVKRFIFSSSSSVVGDTDIYPTPENTVCVPKSPYALQKRIIEEYCRLYSTLYGMDTVCLRYFNVYGPQQYAGSAYSTVVCAWIDSILAGKKLRLDGDGTQSRDFTYVTDACRANIHMALHPGKFKGECYNVANGDSISLNNIMWMLGEMRLSDGAFDIDQKPERPGDVYKTQADISAIRALGFEPETKFEEGLKKTVEWYQTIFQNA